MLLSSWLSCKAICVVAGTSAVGGKKLAGPAGPQGAVGTTGTTGATGPTTAKNTNGAAKPASKSKPALHQACLCYLNNSDNLQVSS